MAIVSCSSSKARDVEDAGDAPDAMAPGDTMDAGEVADANVIDVADAADTAPVDAAGVCTNKFGTALTPAFGRFDGILFALVRPQDQQCPRPNGTHLILETMMQGAVYRLLVRVESDQVQDARVALAERDITLADGAWSEGWHTGVSVDYPTTFGLHDADFTPIAKADLVDHIVGMLKIGDAISVYATGYGTNADGAHDVHRNGSNNDGVLIARPTSQAPHALMFHFAGQEF